MIPYPEAHDDWPYEERVIPAKEVVELYHVPAGEVHLYHGTSQFSREDASHYIAYEFVLVVNPEINCFISST